MKRITMKGKSVDDAVEAALAVLGGKKEDAKINILSEGKKAMLGMIGGEEAEVEVILKGKVEEDAKQMLQDILDKMGFLTKVDSKKEEDSIELKVKGEDMGRIIGKDGTTLKSLEILVGSMLRNAIGEKIRVNIDAGDYKEKRKSALERLAQNVADEVVQTGQEKAMPHMNAADRRLVHLALQESAKVTTFSRGEGRERRLVVAPR
ncbi:MAG: RNA-binding cell elongation regulator Jag/EloR [Candidatus Margulisiibacteriota bacterium]|nr:RNA-binding cell elongation regulator Jag/EloR [Candidatus Margulisiibacteriota bacterium]